MKIQIARFLAMSAIYMGLAGRGACRPPREALRRWPSSASGGAMQHRWQAWGRRGRGIHAHA